ncbi:SCP2 sterol-binding domain-containing protein [Micromonospora sp. NPDC049836]|uniref:SCP2 sterol-binding domain-containing protein n=1 Tax=Micromonospora sp. NPDC049836 TaxID=3364274 RepID=UPI0037985C61
MSDPIEAFFTSLAGQAPGRLHRRTAGTIRFELTGGDAVEHWHLTIADGRIAVSRREQPADTVIRSDRDVFDRMARGEARPLTAWMRNDFTAEGRFRFVVLLARLFPPPAGPGRPGARLPGRAGDTTGAAE